MLRSAQAVEAHILHAMDAADPELAQTRLDAAEDLKPRRRVLLQALILELQGKSVEAAALTEPHPKATQTRFWHGALARVRLAHGDPDAALAELDKTVEGEPTLADLRTRVSAHAARGDVAATIAALETAGAAMPGRLPLSFAVRVLTEAGAHDRAVALMESAATDGGRVQKDALDTFVRTCLLRGEAEALCRHFATLKRIFGQVHILSHVALQSDTPQDWSRIVTSLLAVVEIQRDPLMAYRLANQLLQFGDDEAGERMIERYRSLEAENPALDGPARAELTPARSRLEPIADWLGIPHAHRADWIDRAQAVAPSAALLDYRTMADPAFGDTIHAVMQPVDLDPLRDLVRAGKPAVVALTHAGLLPSTVSYFEREGISIWLLGGVPVMQRLLPGGRNFNPVSIRESATHSLRRFMQQLKQGGLVGTTADGARGVMAPPIRHHGALFRLPTSIPRIVHSRGLPIFWISARWDDGKVVCDFKPAPAPAPGESLTAYTDRWFVFVLDQIRDLCLADPRHIPFDTPLFRDAFG